jgi:hypothetical protein
VSNGHDAGRSKAPTKTDAESAAIKARSGSGCKLATSDCNSSALAAPASRRPQDRRETRDSQSAVTLSS